MRKEALKSLKTKAEWSVWQSIRPPETESGGGMKKQREYFSTQHCSINKLIAEEGINKKCSQREREREREKCIVCWGG